jgi:tetratricopeptide (TPR) repeat protein
MSGSLEDQRDFLLRSLEDLEREHDAGDVDDVDYQTLKDDYTARAAKVLRAIEGGPTPTSSPARPRRSRRTIGIVTGVVVFAVLAGVLLAQSAGRRQEGESATGDIRQSITQRLNSAGQLGSQAKYDQAIKVYDDVLAEDPDNAEAAAYKGWMMTLGGDAEAGLSQLLTAATAHPEYPDGHAFLAVVFFQNGLIDESSRELDRLDALDPPAEVRQLTGQLRTAIDAAKASTTTTSTTTRG